MGEIDTSGKKSTQKENRKLMNEKNVWVVIPVYNNAKSIESVVKDCLAYSDKILVVDDGSTDADLRDLLKESTIKVIRHERNKGKGKALLTALAFLTKLDVDYMITIDGDGQHYASDIPKFLDEIKINDSSIIVGCRDFNADNIPTKSKFGRRFSNMWFFIETGKKCGDTQSGFRAYPIKYIGQIKFSGDFYDFETEVITRAAWAGLNFVDLAIDVHYPKADERVSSFRPFMDNFRISLMHARLVGRRLNPCPHKKLVESTEHFDRTLLKRPKEFFKLLLKENDSPMGLAAAAAVGTVLSVLPLIGLHTVSILYVATRLHLNKVMAVSIQVLYSPPFVPFLCIELGYYLRHGKWLTDFSFSSFKSHAPMVLHDWWVGALILTPIFAVIAAVAVYYICSNLSKETDDDAKDKTEKTW